MYAAFVEKSSMDMETTLSLWKTSGKAFAVMNAIKTE